MDESTRISADTNNLVWISLIANVMNLEINIQLLEINKEILQTNQNREKENAERNRLLSEILNELRREKS